MTDDKQTVSTILVEKLQNHGVKYIFGVPGEENLAFLEAIRKSNIKFITCRHEQGAAFMAATLGRLTGKVGVALSTLGPGATNLVTAVAYANLGGFPLLVITGQKPIKKSKQGKFQIIDVVSMMQPITKYTKTITDAKNTISIINEALYQAETERPGAVHIELPEDIAEEICTAREVKIKKDKVQKINKVDLEKALKTIENSKKPILVLARGCNRKDITPELLSFIKETQIPFVTTQMGKGAIDENMDLYMGTTALSSGDYVHEVLKQSDTIIVIGHDSYEKPPFLFVDKKIIHINYYKNIVDKVYDPKIQIIGDIGSILKELTKKIITEVNYKKTQVLGSPRQIQIEARPDHSFFNNFPLCPEYIVASVQKALPKDGILALDNGMYKLYFTRNFKTTNRNGILVDNTLATMGAGLSQGIAIKIADKNKKVISVCGDGGFLMNHSDLETAVRLKLDLVVLVLDDSGYGMIKWKQGNMHLKNFALSYDNPDFVKLAESFKAQGYKVKKDDDLEKVLKESLKKKGVQIIWCPINYTQSNKYLGQIKN